MIRRQSVIIEGLTLANEVSSYGGGAVEDLRQKLEQVYGTLEATESYCYQMVEENVELWSCSNFNPKRDEEGPLHWLNPLGPINQDTSFTRLFHPNMCHYQSVFDV